MALDLTQFHGTFFDESFEALDSMEAALLALDIGAPDAEGINTIFRVAHSIKGGSGMFAFNEVTSFTHSLETLLDEIRGKRIQITQAIAELLFKSVDIMRELLRGLQSKQPHDAQRVADLQFDIEQLIAGPAAAPVAALPALAAEPTVAVATAATAPVAVTPAVPPSAPQQHDSGSIRVSIEKIDELMNTVGELVIIQAMLSELAGKPQGAAAEAFQSSLAQLERNTRELQEGVMRVRMLPISFVFSRFPRMVRDLAQRLGKQIDLKMTGDQTELDKTVLEKIGDPLTHLVRNCIDHGVELPEARIKAGKPATGTVHLEACHRGGNIAVEVTDDGGGLDKDRILAKARASGLVGPDEQLTDAQIHELIFAPGLSTNDKATDLSGRGVGMDVVRRNVQELGGNVEIRSERGRGSKFIITLPLTLAIVDGQSVAVGKETYIVPLVAIVESLQLPAGGAKRLAGRGEVFAFRGDYLQVLRLHSVFGVEPRSRDLHAGLIVVAEGDGRRIGLFVDELLGQQQVVIKSLQTHYGYVDGVSGATILGDGSVALILDLPGIIRTSLHQQAA